tara:strand:- start:108 stop:281 length:174 start_codon:yes stop_codon:yes gene_type:complete
MKIVKMKDALGNLHSRIPEKDIPYHLKNGWELVEDKPKKSVKPQVEADILTPNEGEE